MIRKDSYWLILLTIPQLWLAYLNVSWMMCKPISMLNLYEDIVGASGVPSGATCFVTNTTTYISFYEFPPLDGNRHIFWIVWILVAVLTAAMIIPTRKLMYSLRNQAASKLA